MDSPYALEELSIPYDARVEAHLVQAGIVPATDGDDMRIPHTLQATLFLRAQGYNAPAPVLTQYEFPASKPAFQAQKTTVGMMTTEPREYVLNSIGTGKTRCVLWAYDYLKREGLAKKLLVQAPISTLSRVWEHELVMEFPQLTFRVLYGTKEKRLKALAEDADIYIINHDGINVIADELNLRQDIDCIAIDELSVYRNGTARRTQVARELSKTRYWVWGLTGSPINKSVCDVWGQCTVVTPWTVPKYFSHLRQNLCHKAGPFKWEANEGAEEKALAYMKPSVRFTLSDVVELPEKVMQYVPVPLGKKQKEVYDAMRTQALALIEDKQIDALNAGAVLSKLLQIAIGWVYTRDKQVIALDNQERVQTIVDFVDACTRKVIIFVPFISALSGIGSALIANGIETRIVSGSTTKSRRDEIFGEFQDGRDVKALAAHPQCMAHGLTLTAADTVIWAGPPNPVSLEIFTQGNGRISRVGQEYKQLIAMIGGTRTEQKLYSLLGDNEQVQGRFLELVEEATRLG